MHGKGRKRLGMTALSIVTRTLEDRQSDPEAYRSAVKAIVTALGTPELAAWDAAEKAACYRLLICPGPCPVRPPIFAHEAASLISSGATEKAANLAAELLPSLVALLNDGLNGNPDNRDAVLLLLVLRAYVGDAIPKDHITQLHLAWFERSTPSDLSLPYSVMFNTRNYEANRDEILAAHPPGRPETLENGALRTWHLTFFEWLAGRSWFRDADNADLERFLVQRLPSDDPEVVGHARSLVLRHFQPSGRLTSASLDRLGLGGLIKQAAHLAELRAERGAARTPSRFGARHLQARPYQAMQLVWSLATVKAPWLNRRQRNLRIAVCVSGQLRGYRRALQSWRRTLFAAADPTFFVHSWQDVGRSDAQPFRSILPFEGTHFATAYREQIGLIGYEAAKSRYPTLFDRLQGEQKADRDAVASVYGTGLVVLEDDRGPDFAQFSNQQKMHYKIHAADRMARAAGEFDLFVRLRPDLEVKVAPFDWRDLLDAVQSRPVVYTEKMPGLHYGNLMVGDQCAIAAPAVMATYAGAWESFPELAGAGLGGCPREFTGHVSLALTCWFQGIAMEKAPVRFGTLIEAAPMSSVEIHSALKFDLADGRPADRTDERLLAAVRQDIGLT